MHQGQRVSTLRKRFWIESVAAGLCTFLFVVTLTWHDWLELVFGIDPDSGSGAAEWLIVGVTAALALTCSLLARIEWRRARPATT
jgi:apolipoprotein N-acyltransferase